MITSTGEVRLVVLCGTDAVAVTATFMAYGFWTGVIVALTIIVSNILADHFLGQYKGGNKAIGALLFAAAAFIVGLTAINKEWGSTAVAVTIICLVMALLSPQGNSFQLNGLFGRR